MYGQNLIKTFSKHREYLSDMKLKRDYREFKETIVQLKMYNSPDE